MSDSNTAVSAPASLGDHLREWRRRRRMSQLDLASEAGISTRHLSFIETGRSSPSREMVLRLAEQLGVPLRERNVLLVAAGFAPVFPERALDDPQLREAKRAIAAVLEGYEPYPALAVDRHWTLLSSNRAAQRLMGTVSPELLKPPVNVMRLALHPNGLAPLTANLGEWRAHLLARLRAQVEMTADPVLADLLAELKGYPEPPGARHHSGASPNAVAVPYQLLTGEGVLSFYSTITVFGTPIDVTLSEIAVEAFLPADGETAEALRIIASSSPVR